MYPTPSTTSKADPVTAALECFHTDGFGVVPAAVPTALVSALRQEADRLLARHSGAGQPNRDYWSFTDSMTCQEILYRIHNLEKQEGALHSAALFASGPLHGLAARIIGGPVRSTACALIVKVPWQAAAVPWHRDRTNVRPGSVCNLSLFLDDCDAANGCLQFVPASHRLPDDADLQTVRLNGPVTDLPMRAGDVAVHDVRTVHASLPNRSARIRRSIVIEFAPTEQETS
jgi:phytanoyl-CoA hydroxylase